MRCALPSSRVRSAHRLQPFSSDPRRTCVQVPASAEGEAAEAEGVLGAAGAASAAPEQATAHPPAPERVEQQLEQQLECPRDQAKSHGSLSRRGGVVCGSWA